MNESKRSSNGGAKYLTNAFENLNYISSLEVESCPNFLTCLCEFDKNSVIMHNGCLKLQLFINSFLAVEEVRAAHEFICTNNTSVRNLSVFLKTLVYVIFSFSSRLWCCFCIMYFLNEKAFFNSFTM